jgi:hypothetical protein
MIAIETNSKETKQMNECIAVVQRWLNVRPFQDNPEWTKAPIAQTSSTWEEWVSKGKEITGVEECLLWMLENVNDPVTRSSVALALGFVGGNHSVNPLISLLETDTPAVQMEAAASLGRLGRSEAVEPLCKALESPDTNVRANGCIALGRLGGKKAITCLKDALKDRDPFVQAAAKEALRGHQLGKKESGKGQIL